MLIGKSRLASNRVIKRAYWGLQYDIIAISVSTGGPKALGEILSRVPGNIPCGIVIVQHMFDGFIGKLAAWLDERCEVKVKKAQAPLDSKHLTGQVGDQVVPGLALIAPGDFHLEVWEDGIIHLTEDKKGFLHQPSADLMMRSIAEIYGPRAIGIILTGLGRDGVEGIKAIKEVGGKTIAQDKDSSVIYDMPKTAINNGYIDKVLPLERIAEELLELL